MLILLLQVIQKSHNIAFISKVALLLISTCTNFFAMNFGDAFIALTKGMEEFDGPKQVTSMLLF